MKHDLRQILIWLVVIVLIGAGILYLVGRRQKPDAKTISRISKKSANEEEREIFHKASNYIPDGKERLLNWEQLSSELPLDRLVSKGFLSALARPFLDAGEKRTWYILEFEKTVSALAFWFQMGVESNNAFSDYYFHDSYCFFSKERFVVISGQWSEYSSESFPKYMGPIPWGQRDVTKLPSIGAPKMVEAQTNWFSDAKKPMLKLDYGKSFSVSMLPGKNELLFSGRGVVRPYTMGKCTLFRLFPLSGGKPVYFQRQSGAVYLVKGLSRNPGHRERISLCETLGKITN